MQLRSLQVRQRRLLIWHLSGSRSNIRWKHRSSTSILQKDNPILVHPEEDWKLKIPLGGDNKRNLCATAREEHGDVDKVLSECAYTVEHTYHTRANQQAMMETFRTACYMDHFGRLIVLSSTQIPFHIRRIVGRALDIPGIQSSCHQTKDRRWLWRKADFCQ